jgi:LmbE family N-acetylglucosaminyl deacetylase
MAKLNSKKVALIVAHPDDETLWAGGTILSHPSWDWFIISLSRGGETGHAQKFLEALKHFGAEGVIGDLDAGDDQNPLNETEVKQTILDLLPERYFDLIISHHPAGEYTDHIRHNETGKAVILLWHSGKISSAEFWAFAYEDGKKSYLPTPIETAGIYKVLTRRIWKKKQSIITEIYGFDLNSVEAKTAPMAESFWPYSSSFEARKLLR